MNRTSLSHLLAAVPTLTAVLTLGHGATAQLSVNTADRGAVADFYRTWFAPSMRNVTPNWTGSAASCNTGSIDQQFIDMTMNRINAYRALISRNGVEYAPWLFNNDDEQSGALMMQISGVVGQQVISSNIPCWTRDGNWALDRSVQDSTVGTDLVDRAMRGTTGTFNQACLIQPTTTRVRIGATDSHMLINRQVYQELFPNTGWTAWPASGFLPYQLAPDTWTFGGQSLPFDPWNLTRRDSFANATVTVTRNGVPLQLTTSLRARREWNWDGISWTFAPGQLQHGPGMGDATYNITIDGVGGFVTTYNYSCTIFDPTPAGSFSTYGSGCGGATLSAAPSSRPAIGSTFRLLFSGVSQPGNLAVLHIGLTQTNIDLSFLGMNGCALFNDIQLSMISFLNGSYNPFDLSIPNDPFFVGGRVYTQGVAVDPPANIAGLVTTNGGIMTFGF